jgi:hypothetical protein
VEAVETLTDVARHAPFRALPADQIDPSQWCEVLEPVSQLLRQNGIEIGYDDPNLERTGPEFGIAL